MNIKEEIGEATSDYINIELPGGFLCYYKTQNTWVIEEIESEIPGTGKKLVRKFVSQVGKDQQVRAAIIERETKRRLMELSYYMKAFRCQEGVPVTDPVILNQLKIVRMFTGGGVKTDKIVVRVLEEAEFEDTFPIAVLYLGRTL